MEQILCILLDKVGQVSCASGGALPDIGHARYDRVQLLHLGLVLGQEELLEGFVVHMREVNLARVCLYQTDIGYEALDGLLARSLVELLESVAHRQRHVHLRQVVVQLELEGALSCSCAGAGRAGCVRAYFRPTSPSGTGCR